MKKIPTLFKRDYEGDRLVYNEVVPGCAWILAGEGEPTVKWDGTACMVKGGKLYKRYDRKAWRPRKKRKTQRRRQGETWRIEDFKPAPPGWIACEPEPDLVSGHWPGWVPIGEGPDDQWHREAWCNLHCKCDDGTYELIGPKVGGNPYRLDQHVLVRHGSGPMPEFPRDFAVIRAWLRVAVAEGIVWHHEDGRMCKIKRRDFGFDWP